MLEQLTHDVLNAIAALRIVQKGCTSLFVLAAISFKINLAYKRLFVTHLVAVLLSSSLTHASNISGCRTVWAMVTPT